MIDFLNSIFYGEHWFIAWGVIFFFFIIGFALQLSPVIKSLKERKKK